jgi:hypothetical protein
MLSFLFSESGNLGKMKSNYETINSMRHLGPLLYRLGESAKFCTRRGKTGLLRNRMVLAFSRIFADEPFENRP